MPLNDGKISIKINGDVNPADKIVIIKTSDLSLEPSDNWEVVAEVNGDIKDIPLVVQPGQHKFSGYVKGFWNRSDFSQAVITPPVITATAISLTVLKA